MRLARLTTRWWIAAIAVIGIVLGEGVGIYRLWRRHLDLTERARNHAGMARWYGSYGPAVMSLLEITRGSQEQADLEHIRIILPLHIAYHEKLADKYRRGACYPWLLVEPDPPEPPE
jgi:hypothetical protein